MSRITTHRVLAFIIDTVFISIINTILSGFIDVNYELYSFELLDRKWEIVNGLYPLVLLLYFLFFDLFKNGLSIGKSFFAIKITATSSELNKATLVKRTLLKFIFTYSPLFLVLIIYYAVKGTVLYDNLTNTKVEA